MTKKNEHMLSSPTRQSYVAIILILFKFIRVLIRAGWPLFLVLFLQTKGNTFNNYILMIALGISFLSLIGSLFAYFKYHFFIKDEELYIEKGVLRKTKLNIPFERIQTVNFEQNLIHQFFDVVSVKINTAGSSASEFNIDAIDKEKAYFLRDYVLASKVNQGIDETLASEDEAQTVTADNRILHLQPIDLLKIGVSQNHIRTAGVIMLFFFGLLDNIEDALNKKIEVIYQEYVGIQIDHWLSVMAATIVFFIFISFLLTLVRTVIHYYNLSLWRTSTGYKVQSGLFTRREDAALKDKIQLIKWQSNPFQRIFGIHHLQLRQASSISIKGKGSIAVPGCYQDQIDLLKADNFPSKDLVQFTTHGISPLIIGRYTIYFGLDLCLLALIILYPRFELYSLLCLVWLPICYILVRVYQANWRWEINEELLQTRKGIFSHQHLIFQLYKAQSVKLVQSIYQRRKNLATIVIYTAAGKIKIPFINLALAKELQNYIIYKIESDNRQWM